MDLVASIEAIGSRGKPRSLRKITGVVVGAQVTLVRCLCCGGFGPELTDDSYTCLMQHLCGSLDNMFARRFSSRVFESHSPYFPPRLT